MQDVQARMRLVAPFTLACTGRKLTFQRLRDTLWAWLMVFPNSGFLPQISQTCAMTAPGEIRNPTAKYRFYRSWGGFGKSQNLKSRRAQRTTAEFAEKSPGLVFQNPLSRETQDLRRLRIPQRSVRHVRKDLEALIG